MFVLWGISDTNLCQIIVRKIIDMKMITFGICGLLVVGCATVPQQPMVKTNQDQSGRIRVFADSEQAHSFLVGLDKRLYITSVDKESTNTVCFNWPNCYAQEVFVEPGRHYLNLKFAHMNSYAEGTVWFDADVGRSYVVRKRLLGYRVQFWVEDASTGTPVGGYPGSEDEKK